MRKIISCLMLLGLFAVGYTSNAACPGFEEVGDIDGDGYIIVYSEDQGDGSCKDCSDTCKIAV